MAEEINSPPRITASYPAEGEVFTLDLPENTAFILVRDDNDPYALEYRWTIENLGTQGTAVPLQGNNEQGSKLVLGRDDVYDGRTLEVRVTDGFGVAVTREWLLDIPEVAR